MQPPTGDHPGLQTAWLFLLAIPVACVAWTVTHEEIFRDPREFCQKKSQECRALLSRKFFYLFTCEYCFSHYVALAFIALTGYRLLLDDWRGYVIAFFAIVAVSNLYISVFSRLRIDIRAERAEAEVREREAEKRGAGSKNNDGH